MKWRRVKCYLGSGDMAAMYPGNEFVLLAAFGTVWIGSFDSSAFRNLGDTHLQYTRTDLDCWRWLGELGGMASTWRVF